MGISASNVSKHINFFFFPLIFSTKYIEPKKLILGGRLRTTRRYQLINLFNNMDNYD